MLKEVLSGLQTHSIAGKWSKYEFVTSSVQSVDYHGEGRHPTDEKIAFVNAAEAHTHLGLLKYYKIFQISLKAPAFAQTAP